MKKTDWYNHKGRAFRIKIDSYEKIEKLGKAAGKYLTLYSRDGIKDNYKLTDIRNEFNADRTHKYSYKDEFDDGFEQPSIYDCIAWSLGYVYTSDEYLKFYDMQLEGSR